MTRKHYTLGAFLALLLGGTLAVAPVFADTNSPGMQHGPRAWGDMKHMPMMGSGVFGKVTAVNGNTLTVSGRNFPGMMPEHHASTTMPMMTTYTVDATNAAVYKGNATSTVSAIAVNDQIFVQGTVNGTSVTATTIRDGLMKTMRPMPTPKPVIQGNGQPVIAGSVSAVNGSTFTLTNSGSAMYSVDATNAVIRKGNATSTASSIATGDHVVVQGSVNGTSIIATTVFDQAAQGTSGQGKGPMKGFLGSIGGFFKHLFGF